MLHIRIAAFPSMDEAQHARRELDRVPDGIADATVQPRSIRASLGNAWRPLVRTRARRALFVGFGLGLLVAGAVTFAFMVAGFDRVLTLALAAGAMAAMAGALIGWLVGAYLIGVRFQRVLRDAPSADAVLAARVRSGPDSERFDRVCRAHGALASAAG